MYTDLQTQILPLHTTRVWRTYFGGQEIERWQGRDQAADGDKPEEWIASVVSARNPGREHIVEGLSEIRLPDLPATTLKAVIDSDPAAFLGSAHAARYGSNPAVLAKIIDSLGRLTIQVHPDKAFAKQVLNSDYGKTECWYILGGREVNGEKPYVLMGFKSGITREYWKSLFEQQDIQGMVDALHKIYVQPGETYFIAGGVPHAIGSGCFLMEVQEPTDYTFRVERTTPEGLTIPDFLCHQGTGFENLYDCFHYDGLTLDETLARWRIAPRLIAEQTGGEEWEILGAATTPLFAMHKLQVSASYTPAACDSFSSLTVTAGAGRIHYGARSLEVKQGDCLFVPAQVGMLRFEASTGNTLEVLRCFPPR